MSLLAPQKWPDQRWTLLIHGQGFLFCPGQILCRLALPLGSPRRLVCHLRAGHLLRETQVVRVGRQEGRNSPGFITLVQTSVLRPKPREALWGPGTTHYMSIKSAQPTCSFMCDLKSQATRNE